jgi:hypothetical protein
VWTASCVCSKAASEVQQPTHTSPLGVVGECLSLSFVQLDLYFFLTRRALTHMCAHKYILFSEFVDECEPLCPRLGVMWVWVIDKLPNGPKQNSARRCQFKLKEDTVTMRCRGNDFCHARSSYALRSKLKGMRCGHECILPWGPASVSHQHCMAMGVYA